MAAPLPGLGAGPREVIASRATPVFHDRAEALGVRFAYDNGGSGRYTYLEMAGGGVALLDYDGDGRLDLFFPQGAALPGHPGGALTNSLYRNLGPGKGFQDVTERAGVTGVRNGEKAYLIGCAVGDFDNDGHADLFVTGYRAAFLYRNRGDGTFEDATRRAGIADCAFGSSAAFWDYDRDGRLDLFVCEYLQYDLARDVHCQNPAGARDYCRPDFYPSARSRLYHNEGNGQFRDVTVAAGLTRSSSKALGVVTGDLDADGDSDLYLACDMTPNLLYVNQGDGTFKEEALSRNCALSTVGNVYSGMGVDCRDADGDLLPDLWVTNYWDEANNLYRNLGQGSFQDVAPASGLPATNQRQVCFGTALRDFNQDGWLDLFITNGHVLDHPEGSTPGADRSQKDELYLNQGRGFFRDATAEAGSWFSKAHVGRGAAFGDLDNDGDLDIVLSQNAGRAAVLMNEGAGLGHWIQLRLIGTKSNRDGIGATVEISAGGRTQRDEVRSAYSYCSASDLRLHFGLGTAAVAERVVVRWPSGTATTLAGLAADRIWSITEGESSARPAN